MNAVPNPTRSMTFILHADNTVQTSFTGNMDITTILTLMFTVMESLMHQVAEKAIAANPDVPEDQIKGEIYDMVNCGASNVLDHFMPTPTNFSDQLTAEAIKRAEDEILEEMGELDDEIPDQLTFSEVVQATQEEAEATLNNITPFPTRPSEVE